jgi:hypothetical protein
MAIPPTIRPHWTNGNASQLEIASEQQVHIFDALNKRGVVPSRWRAIGTVTEIDSTSGKKISEMDSSIWFDFDNLTADALFFKLEGSIPNLRLGVSRNAEYSEQFDSLHALFWERLSSEAQTSIPLSTLHNVYGINETALELLIEKLSCAPSPIFTRKGFVRSVDRSSGPQYLFAAKSESELTTLKLR